ncbi:sulfur carrier protein ThiS [Campylobacter upsaliensis]
MIINGEKLDLKELKLMDYVRQKGLRADLIALELNGKIVPKSEFETLILRQDDRAEIVSFVGGG